VYLRSDEKSLIVTDVEWFMSLLYSVSSECKEKSGDCRISCLNESTVIWRDKYLLKMAMKYLKDESLVLISLHTLTCCFPMVV